MSLPRSAYIPAGATKVACKGTDALAYVYTARSGKAAAAMFSGKAAKPAAHYSYRNPAEREASVRRFFESALAIAASKAKAAEERREALAKGHGLEVGHVFSSSWGYEQTNVDFYVVTKLIGRRMVELRKCACIRHDTSDVTGSVTPDSTKLVGEPIRRQVTPQGGVRITSYAYASLWDGRPERFSSYA